MRRGSLVSAFGVYAWLLATAAAVCVPACSDFDERPQAAAGTFSTPGSDDLRSQAEALLASSPPTARSGPSVVWDEGHSRMIIFGGNKGGYLNDVHILSVANGSWTWSSPSVSGVPPSGRQDHSAVWDAANDRMIVFGGYYGFYPYLNDVHILSELDGDWTWSSPTVAGTGPSGRFRHSAVWDEANSRMVVFGGDDLSRRDDVHVLSESSGAWAWSAPVVSGTAPSARVQHSAVWDVTNGRMILFGGYDGSYLGEVHILSESGGTWTWSSPSVSGEAPSGRHSHSAVWDGANGRMFVFGGSDGSRRNDVWMLSNSEGIWTWSGPGVSGALPTGREHHSAVWDATNGRMLVFGGYDGSARNDLHMFEELGGTWTWSNPSAVGTVPSERYTPSAVWDADHSRMVVFGGYSGSRLNDVWVLSDSGGSWTWAKPTVSGSAPTPRLGHSAVWDAANGHMIVFGGDSGSRLNDVWILSDSAGTWAWTSLTVSGTAPTARAGHSAVWDASTGRMIVFGGYSGSYQNDIWVLSESGGTWNWTSPAVSGTAPAPRYDHSAVWDSENSRMIVFGGDSESYLNDVGVLSESGGTWAWTSPAVSGIRPAARYGHSAVLDAGSGRMIVFGGDSGSRLNDVWVLSDSRGAWAWASPAVSGTAPLARLSHSAVWDAANGRMILFGGSSPSSQNDTWTLRGSAGAFFWHPLRMGVGCEFEPPLPTSPLPTDGATLTACGTTLSWDVPATVTGFDFEVYVNDRLIGITTAEELTVPPHSEMLPTGNRWSVTSTGCAGIGTTSEEQTFSVQAAPPSAPTLVAALDLACDTATQTLSWTDVAAGYDVYINGDLVGSDLVEASLTLPAGYGYEVTNSWYVVARNCVGDTAASTTDSFDTTSATTLTTPTLTPPISPAYCDDTFNWTYEESDGDVVIFDIVSSDGGTVYASGLTGRSWTPSRDERLPSGSYAMRVRARNCAGATVLSGARSVTIDNTPPPPVLSTPTVGQVTDGTPTLSWNVPAATKGDVVYSVELDGSEVATGIPMAASSVSIPYPLAEPLAEGEHTWEVVATGCHGATSRSGTRTFIVDLAGPESLAIVAPTHGDWFSGFEPIVLDWTDATDSPAGVQGYNVAVAWPDEGGTVFEQAYGAGTTSHSANTDPEGAYSWSVTAIDNVGNETTTGPSTFGVDYSAPTAPGLTSPLNDAVTTLLRPTFSWIASTDELSGVDHYELIIDGAQNGDSLPAGATSVQSAVDLDEGQISWQIDAVDAVGNRASSASHRLWIDRTPPDVPTLIAVNPSGSGEWVSDRIPEFVFRTDDNPLGSGIAYFDLYIDGQPDGGNPVTASEANRCGDPDFPQYCRYAFDLLDEGPHSWSVVAYDNAGNSRESDLGEFSIETVAPEAFNHTSPENGATVQSLRPLLCWQRTTDAGSGLDHYTVNIQSSGVPDVNIEVAATDSDPTELCGRPTADLTNGSYTWLVTAYDRAGKTRTANGGARYAMTVEQDVTPPTSGITRPSAETAVAGCTAYAFEGTASDPGPTESAPAGSGAIQVEVQIDSTGDGGWSDATLTGSPSDAERGWSWSWPDPTTGTHIAYVRATDAEGNTQVTPTERSFEVDCAGPADFSLSSPSNESYAASCPTFEWEATTDSPAGMGRYELRIQSTEGGDEQVIDAGEATSYTLSSDECYEAPDVFTWRVRAYDALDNATDSLTSRTLRVDTDGPNAFSLQSQSPVTRPDGFVCNGREVTVGWGTPTDAGPAGGVGLAPSPYQVYLNGSPWGGRTASTSRALSGLDDGQYTWTVRAYDALDNWTDASPFGANGAFDIDCTGPGLSETASLRLNANDIPTFARSTGLTVEGGDLVRIWADGLLCFTDDASCDPDRRGSGACLGPNGQWPFPDWIQASRYYQTIDFGAIVGLVGAGTADPIVIGDALSFSAPRTGLLHLAVNDNDRYNCRSRWHEVTVQTGDGFELLFPTENSLTDDSTPLVEWSPVTDDGVGVDRIRVLLNGSQIDLNLPGDATEYTVAEAYELAEGTHTWNVIAYDALGNSTSPPTARRLRVDRSPPLPFSLQVPVEGVVVTTTTPILEWSAAVDTYSGISDYLVYVDDAYNTAQYGDGGTCTPSQGGRVCAEPAAPLSEGRHSYRVYARDLLIAQGVQRHETASTEEHSFIVDTLPPDDFALVSPDDGIESFTARPELCWELTADAGTGVVRYHAVVTSTPQVTIDVLEADITDAERSAGVICRQPASNIPNGNHGWHVLAYDGAPRNPTQSDSRSIIIDRDLTPPLLTIEQPAPGALVGATGVALEIAADDGSRGTGTASVEVYATNDLVSLPSAAFDEELGRWTLVWPVTADGSLTLCAVGTDYEGNVTPESGDYAIPCVTIQTDVSPPLAFRVVAPDGDAWVGARPSFNWDATSDAPAGVQRYLLAIAGEPEISTLLATNYQLSEGEALTDGDYSWSVRAVDMLGNSRESTNTASFRVDTLRPRQVNLASPASTTWVNTREPEVCWNATTDRGSSGIASYHLTLSGSGYSVASSETCVTAPSLLGDGPHDWTAAAVDAAGNLGDVSDTWVIQVDVNAPTAPTLTYPLDGMHIKTNPPVLRWLEVSDLPVTFASGVCSYSVTLGDETETLAEPSGELEWPQTITDGEVDWYVVAYDCAGNPSAQSATRTLRLDTAPPSDVVITAPTADAWSTDRSPTVTWLASSEVVSSVVTYELDLDGSVQELAGTTLSFEPAAELAEGWHEVTLTARDQAGNESTPTTLGFGVDASAPDAAVLTLPGPNALVADLRPTFAWLPCSDSFSGVAAHTLLVDGSSAAGDLSGVASGAEPTVDLVEGPHNWAVSCADNATLATTTDAQGFVVDVSPPLAFGVVSPTEATWVNGRPTFTWNATSDAYAGVERYVLGIDGESEIEASLATTYELAEGEELADGDYTWSVRAVDSLGHSRTSTVGSFRVDTLRPPQVTLASPPTTTWVSTRQPEVCWNATTDRGSSGITSYAVMLSGASHSVTSAETCLTAPSPLGDGPHDWTVSAEDAAGNVGNVSETRVVQIDVTPPVAPTLTYPLAGMHIKTNPPVLRWQEVDDRPATFASGVCSYSLTLGDETETTEGPTGEMEWPRPVTDGEVDWYVTANDCAGNSGSPSSERTLRLDTVPPSTVVISTPTEGEWTTDHTPTITWEASTEAVSSVVAYALDLDDTIHELSGSTLTFTPESDLVEGSHEVSLSARDQAGNESPASIITFGVDNTPPNSAVLSQPAPGTCVGTVRPTFMWSPCSDDASSIAAHTLLIGGSDAAGELAGNATSALPTSDLSEGAHTFAVSCVDQVALEATTDATSFVVDVTRPTASLDTFEYGSESGYDLAGVAADAAPCALAVELRVDEGEWVSADLDRGLGTWTYTGLALDDGERTITLRATDAAGNTTEEQSWTVMIGQCWEPADCDDEDGTCYVAAGTDVSCDDGDACSETDLCNGEGVCEGTPLVCSDGDACNGLETCVDGACVDGTPMVCTDGDPCNGLEICSGGVCLDGSDLTCDDTNPCTDDSCATGVGCRHEAVDDGLGCADDDVCNGDEVCLGGVCEAAEPLHCADADPCSLDTCDPVEGCQNEPADDGEPCDSDTVCDGTCQDGLCEGGTEIDCTSDSPCVLGWCADSDEGGYECVYDSLALEDQLCDDDDACTASSFCVNGVCEPDTDVNCDDSDECTADGCDVDEGCWHDTYPECLDSGDGGDIGEDVGDIADAGNLDASDSLDGSDNDLDAREGDVASEVSDQDGANNEPGSDFVPGSDDPEPSGCAGVGSRPAAPGWLLAVVGALAVRRVRRRSVC